VPYDEDLAGRIRTLVVAGLVVSKKMLFVDLGLVRSCPVKR